MMGVIKSSPRRRGSMFLYRKFNVDNTTSLRGTNEVSDEAISIKVKRIASVVALPRNDGAGGEQALKFRRESAMFCGTIKEEAWQK